MTTIYKFKNLPLELIGQVVARIPVLSNGEDTVVFIDDFTNLDEDLQETCLDYDCDEI